MVAKVAGTKVDAGAIVPVLRGRERGFGAKIAVMLAVGMPMSLIGPVVLGSMFWVACLILWRWYPWWWFFWGGMVVVVPLLYRMETRGGDYLQDAVKSGAPNVAAGLWVLSRMRGGGMLAIAAVAAQPRAAAAGFVEIFLFGPRQVVSAVRQWRAARMMRSADVMLAANVVAALLGSGKSIATRQLPAGDKMEALAPVLAYLVFFDWIGLSADAEKVWILTEAKEALKGMG